MKKKKRKKLKKTLQPKAPLSIKETEQKIRAIRAKLQDLKEYKVILAEDGLKADEEDKRRESELIIRLLRLEKTPGINKETEAPWRGKAAGKPEAGKPGTRSHALLVQMLAIPVAANQVEEADQSQINQVR